MKREQAGHALPHPLHAVREELTHLRDVAERGESGATPAVVIGGLALVFVPLIAAIIATVLAVGYFASRGSGGVTPASKHPASTYVERGTTIVRPAAGVSTRRSTGRRIVTELSRRDRASNQSVRRHS